MTPTTDKPDNDMARLVYLVTKFRIEIPRQFVRVIPFGEALSSLSAGIGATDAPVESLLPLFKIGESMGEGSREEVSALFAKLLEGYMPMEPVRRLAVYRWLTELTDERDQGALLQFEELDLDPEQEILPIPKFQSGFHPADIALGGGFYQGLFMLMAEPGMGKTSIMLSIMESLIATEACNSVWFLESEIPGPMLLGRIGPIMKRIQFRKGRDRILSGPFTAEKILEMIAKDPDPDRVIIYDGPDVHAAGEHERHIELEMVYQKLIQVKLKAKMVLVSSQPKQRDTQLSLRSPAGSWAKVWYADAILGIQAAGPGRLQIRTLKNRFGAKGATQFRYGYEELEWDMPEAEGDWGDW